MVTIEKIQKDLEGGVIPWRKTWGNGVREIRYEWMPPVNARSKRPYQGVNALMLSMAEMPSPYWGTMKTWEKLGGHVVDDTPTMIHWRRYRLYNLSQVSGVTIPQVEGTDEIKVKCGEIKINEIKIRCEIKVSSEPYYDFTNDIIYCPPQESFESDVSYMATFTHELAHWTGHPSRLNRVFGRDINSVEYAYEELVADLGSCFLLSRLNVRGFAEYMPQYIGYLKVWRSILNDERALVRAAHDAEKIVSYLLPRT